MRVQHVVPVRGRQIKETFHHLCAALGVAHSAVHVRHCDTCYQGWSKDSSYVGPRHLAMFTLRYPEVCEVSFRFSVR